MDISIRKFKFKDIPDKVKWINNPQNHKYLHYDLPLKQDKTEKWFVNNQYSEKRYDAVIKVDGKLVGIIGIVNIDNKKKQGEYYITIGEEKFKGKGIAFEASNLLLEYVFNELNLKKVYLFTEHENLGMQKLAERLGMLKEALLLDHSIRDEELHNTYYYTMLKSDYNNNIKFPSKILSNIEYLETDKEKNNVYIKRDDLLSFSFGGNKARKSRYFFERILSGNYKTVITYGSKFSNHCRVVANLCKKNNLKCIIISPYGSKKKNFNRTLIEMNDAIIKECDIKDVSSTIDQVLDIENRKTDNKAYFIPGGGHGNIGTQAYIDAYHEIEIWSRKNNKKFDYIFVASGTGTTQAGLIIGKHIHRKLDSKIVGVSIAREKEYGSMAIAESILDYSKENDIIIDDINSEINFYDDLIINSYGKTDESINSTVLEVYEKFGIPLSLSYTGKAFVGMNNYIQKNNLKNKNILFLNTGGLPLFFDDLLNYE